MKSAALLAAVCATAVFAKPEQVEPRALFTIEVAPGETRQITEEERWEISAVSNIQLPRIPLV
jgi:leucyl aminopeptidase